jgi:hypothetical protein
MAFTVTNVEESMKNINSKKTMSVMEDMLKLGSTLFLPLKFILASIRYSQMQ